MVNRRRPHAVAAAEDALIRCVRAKGNVARGALADELGLVPSTIGVYVERLVQQGFLLESVAPERGLGRPPVLLQLNPQRGRFIGIDFEGHELAGIAVDFSQAVLKEIRITLQGEITQDSVLTALQEIVQQLIAEHSSDVLGIGIAVPGEVNHVQGTASAPSKPSDRTVSPSSEIASFVISAAQVLSERNGIPVTIENNIRSMALAEYWFGLGKGKSRLVCLGVRSQVGMGIVLNGSLYRGATNRAGDLASWFATSTNRLHGRPTVLPAESGSAPARSPSIFERIGSVSTLLNEWQQRLTAEERSSLSFQAELTGLPELFEAATRGDERAVELLQTAAAGHAKISQTILSLLDPDQIIVGGPLIQSSLYWEALHKHCLVTGGDELASRVVPSEFGHFAGACGAAALAVHHWTP